MSQTMDFERLVADWLKTDGPADIRSEVVGASLRTARASGQRRGLRLALVGPAPWPAYGRRIGFGTLPPAVRVAIALALLMALVAGTAFVGSRLLRSAVVPRFDASAEAVFLRTASGSGTTGAQREIDVVAVRADGTERVLRRLTSSVFQQLSQHLGGAFEPSGSVSFDGQLAIDTNLEGPASSCMSATEWALIDLTSDVQTGRPPLAVPYQRAIGGAWSPNGLFATTVPCDGGIQVANARTGETTTLGHLALPGGSSLIWAADGSGLLVQVESYVANSGITVYRFGIAPATGGPLNEIVPRLSFGLGARYVSEGGRYLLDCANGLATAPACDGTGFGGVWIASSDKNGYSGTAWYGGELAPDRLASASFAANDRSVWLLFDRESQDLHQAVLAIEAESGRPSVRATARLGTGITRLWFEGFAPDDSIVAVGYTDRSGQSWTTLVPTIGGHSLTYPSSTMSFIGFLAAPFADSLPGVGGLEPAT